MALRGARSVSTRSVSSKRCVTPGTPATYSSFNMSADRQVGNSSFQRDVVDSKLRLWNACRKAGARHRKPSSHMESSRCTGQERKDRRAATVKRPVEGAEASSGSKLEWYAMARVWTNRTAGSTRYVDAAGGLGHYLPPVTCRQECEAKTTIQCKGRERPTN